MGVKCEGRREGGEFVGGSDGAVNINIVTQNKRRKNNVKLFCVGWKQSNEIHADGGFG